MNMRRLRISTIAATTFAMATGLAAAADVNINVAPRDPSAPVVVQPAPPVVVQPRTSGSTVIVVPDASAPQTVLADNIKAHEVRAQTIYANKIKAREVQGVVHQTKKVDIGRGTEDVKAPLVTASVIYADDIEAERVIAANIYVRELDRD